MRKNTEEKVILRKPNPVIGRGGTGRLGIISLKIYNVLLYNARKNLEQDEFSINKNELYELIGYDSSNDETLKECLRRLLSSVIEWDIIRPKRKRVGWIAFTLVSKAELRDGQIIYRFDPDLKEKLLNPQNYFTLLPLRPMTLYSSKHGLILHEVCKQFADINKTPWIEIATFRNLTGTTGKYYDNFGQLNRQVIQKAILQVNQFSDMKVTLQTKRTKRHITEIRFLIAKNEQESLLSIQDQLQVQLHPAEKDLRVQSQKCFQGVGNFGNCGSIWSNHEKKEDICRYCQKFSQNVSES